ncbi:uncharacterized protein PV09_06955 [Verruconis gallopava]|uniref:Coenzyme Q-binding protein COQ10 START domain-containing protein n=1 Tax=Verruconis gallopava TaxID=253628 RepID=A0A0D2A4S5_9PEZI|nr:uncharacterized protein PV09_06955 [Verruconis gallopava]KIW01783.1 hypothetical protein PV09_06955 [Verruconis gallopava]
MKAQWIQPCPPQQLRALRRHGIRPITPASHRFLTAPFQRRRFISPPFSTSPPTQSLTASRTLPYPPRPIYSVIADVDSYSNFLPFCESSTVTSWSQPDRDGRKWPSEAELLVGWKGVTEAFTSRIYCIPGRIVEAVSGATQTTLPRHEIAHHFGPESSFASKEQKHGVLSHLLTRWTVRQAKQDASSTDVSLAIEFQFSNPIYSAMSGAVADKVASYMIEAFEQRVRHVLRHGSDGDQMRNITATGSSR